MEVEEARLEKIAVTRRVGLINLRSNSKSIRSKMEMYIIRATMGFTLLTESACASVTRVVGLIPHTSMASMIHGASM